MHLKTLGIAGHNKAQWQVLFDDDFASEVRQLPQPVREQLKAAALVLSQNGPLLQRPHADTLKGSRHANMKELRFSVDGAPWRVAYAFDPERKAILLVGGDKGGVGQARFYQVFCASRTRDSTAISRRYGRKRMSPNASDTKRDARRGIRRG